MNFQPPMFMNKKSKVLLKISTA